MKFLREKELKGTEEVVRVANNHLDADGREINISRMQMPQGPRRQPDRKPDSNVTGWVRQQGQDMANAVWKRKYNLCVWGRGRDSLPSFQIPS